MRTLRPRSRPHHAGKNRGRRAAGGRVRRKAPLHGSAGAARPGYQAGTLERQSAGHGRRHRHHRDICRNTPQLSTRRLSQRQSCSGRSGGRSSEGRSSAHHKSRGCDVDVVLYAGTGAGLRRRGQVRHGRIRALSSRMLEHGIWLPPSQFEAAFLGTAHGDSEVNATIEAARNAFQSVLAR